MKRCRYCQTEIDKKAKICPQCRKNQSGPLASVFRAFFGVIIVLIGISVIINAVSNVGEDKDKCYISLDEFNRIKNGMSYDQVKEIVGCEGTVNSDTEIMGSKMTIYSWYGKDGISNANINIQDGKLINKTQIGLK